MIKAPAPLRYDDEYPRMYGPWFWVWAIGLGLAPGPLLILARHFT